jgi:predicted nucleic-acid-binding Zn-ribbon protein
METLKSIRNYELKAMAEQSLKSGTCPKCGSGEVYTDSDLAKRGERMQLVISSWKWYFLDTYICLGCYHFEEHISEKEKGDAKVIEKIKETWNKV